MMKMGVPTSGAKLEQNKPKESSNVKNATSAPISEPSFEAVPYDKWDAVVERIGELKRSLSSQFVGASAYKTGDGSFLVKMNEFFASRIIANVSDFAILKGVIAEVEGKTAADINVTVEKAASKTDGFQDDFESLLK